MGIPAVGADVIVTPQQGLILPAMSSEPLQTALLNTNWLYVYRWAPLVTVCPSEPTAMARTAVVVVPVRPSVDGLRYDFHVEAVCSADTNLTVVVEETDNYTGLPTSGSPTAWTAIFTTVSAETAGARAAQITTGQTIAADTVALRFTVSVAAGTFELHHLLAFPHPATIAAGSAASGFVPYDDGILTTAGGPVHTELLDRCAYSTAAILRDRWEMAASLCQDEAQANVDLVATNRTEWAVWPVQRVWLPGQSGPVKLRVRSLISISAGAGADLVRLAQVPDPAGVAIPPPQSVTLDGSTAGMVDTATLTVYPQGDGLLRYVDLQPAIRTTAANTTYLHALVAFFEPGAT
jgi:hypothetical protein